SDDAIWVKNEIKRQCGNLTISDDSVDADSNNDDNSMQAILSTTILTSNSNVELDDNFNILE
ncbi:302_t:CDS:2, partial [Entrophospora sp. SA101]